MNHGEAANGRDNKTSQPAQEYDANIEKTIPMYRLFHEQTMDLVTTLHPEPQAWLDAGCGTGALAARASEKFDITRFFLTDPSSAMVEIAEEKLLDIRDRCTFIVSGTEELHLPHESLDVISAILSHHYVSLEVRQLITENCYHMLKPGGLYITFESIRPATETGLQIGLERWRQVQLQTGKSPAAVAKHISRYGIEFLPIPIAQHLDLLRDSGFTTVELFWASYLQAGFYAIK
jgi:tRNA (cmo5U34)-methyltransferase